MKNAMISAIEKDEDVQGVEVGRDVGVRRICSMPVNGGEKSVQKSQTLPRKTLNSGAIWRK